MSPPDKVNDDSPDGEDAGPEKIEDDVSEESLNEMDEQMHRGLLVEQDVLYEAGWHRMGTRDGNAGLGEGVYRGRCCGDWRVGYESVGGHVVSMSVFRVGVERILEYW